MVGTLGVRGSKIVSFDRNQNVDTKVGTRGIDRGFIFSSILDRNALRREAQLPVRDVRATFDLEVRHALWREHVKQHHETVRAQVLRAYRERISGEVQSAGGRWAINAMTLKALAESFVSKRVAGSLPQE